MPRWQTLPVNKFGGLIVGGTGRGSDLGDVGISGAIDIVNVDIAADRSFIRTRDGLSRLTSAGVLFGGASGVCYRTIVDGGSNSLLTVTDNAGANTIGVDSTNVGGVVTAIGSWAGTSTGTHDAVNFGTPTNTIVFISSANSTLRKVTAGVLAVSVGVPKYVAVSPLSNRLIQGWFGSAASSPTAANGSTSTVFFSDAGAPETFSAANFVHLRPGDGEEIRGIVNYGTQTWVFKETSVFIFSGEGIGPTGGPEFDYRVMTLPSRIRKPLSDGPMVGAGARGVYYAAVDGVYRTTGGPPVKISQALDSNFQLGTDVVNHLSVVGTRVFLASGTSPTRYTIFDEQHGQWSRWEFTGAWSAPLIEWARLSGSIYPPLVAVKAAGTVYVTSPTATSDDGTAIASTYWSGFDDLGAPTLKTLRQTQVWGSGSPTLGIYTDYLNPATDTGARALTLGTPPLVDDAVVRYARRGTRFSYKLSAASGAWYVYSLAFSMSSAQRPGAKV